MNQVQEVISFVTNLDEELEENCQSFAPLKPR